MLSSNQKLAITAITLLWLSFTGCSDVIPTPRSEEQVHTQAARTILAAALLEQPAFTPTPTESPPQTTPLPESPTPENPQALIENPTFTIESTAVSETTPTPTSDPTALLTACLSTDFPTQIAIVLAAPDGLSLLAMLEDGSIVTIRYLGLSPITVPEAPPNAAQIAAEANRALALGRVVALQQDKIYQDPTGALPRYVLLDGILLNEVLARGGYALAASQPADLRCAQLLAQAEALARQERLGVWSGVFIPQQPTPAGGFPTAGFSPTSIVQPTADAALQATAFSTVPPTVMAVFPTALPLSTPLYPTAAIQPTPVGGFPTALPLPPIPPAPCLCTGPDLDCRDFGVHSSAQACFDYCVSQGFGDIFLIDINHNGLACESLLGY